MKSFYTIAALALCMMNFSHARASVSMLKRVGSVHFSQHLVGNNKFTTQANAHYDLKNTISKEKNRYDMTLYNNFLFLVPPILWNLAFTSKLPMDHFSGQAPNWVLIPENIARIATFTYPLLLPVTTDHAMFRPGLATYTIGLAAYFGSWAYLMAYPESGMAHSTLMRFAPAYTPIIWLSGISMMSESKVYPIVSTIFITFHVLEYIYRYQN